jgi:hypothetical protein
MTHDCLATHLHKIKVYSSDKCTLCRIQGTSINADHLLNCGKLDSSAQTVGDIAKLYWDARFLMSWMPSNGRPLEEEQRRRDILKHADSRLIKMLHVSSL